MRKRPALAEACGGRQLVNLGSEEGRNQEQANSSGCGQTEGLPVDYPWCAPLRPLRQLAIIFGIFGGLRRSGFRGAAEVNLVGVWKLAAALVRGYSTPAKAKSGHARGEIGTPFGRL